MLERLPVALAAGLLAAFWVAFSSHFSLTTWVGFLGCSAYFAQGKFNAIGVVSAWATTLSGVFWAWLILFGAEVLPASYSAAILTGVVTVFMCLQSQKRLLAFIPGTFIGCCCLFATQGDLAAVILPLLAGVVLGYAMSRLSNLFAQCLPARAPDCSQPG